MTAATSKKIIKTVPSSTERPKASGLGLEGVGEVSALLDTPTAAANDGDPLELDMELIDEDPKQPRTKDNPGFSDKSLGELAASIRRRGVKTPISVRHNADAPGRYLINHGARRFRGSRRAGKTIIPGFIDNDYNETDQVVENLQRNELTAREIADYIGRELAKGIKKGEIAKAISKSPAFVTQHVTLLDLPDPIAQAFNAGRARDVTVVNELVTAFRKKPQEVSDWLDDENQEITRGSVKLLRDFLDDKAKAESDESDESDETDANMADASTSRTDTEAAEGEQASVAKTGKEADPAKLKKAIILVRYDDRLARLLLNRRPPAEGFAWLKYEDDGQEIEANLAEVKLVALLEG